MGQKHNRSHEDASDEDLQSLKFSAPVSDQQPAEGKQDSSLEDALAGMSITPDPFKDVPVLSRTSAELYLFDTETDVFVIQEKDVDVDLVSNGDYDGEYNIPRVLYSRWQFGSLSVIKTPHLSRFLSMKS
jgi:hypothetical protein